MGQWDMGLRQSRKAAKTGNVVKSVKSEEADTGTKICQKTLALRHNYIYFFTVNTETDKIKDLKSRSARTMAKLIEDGQVLDSGALARLAPIPAKLDAIQAQFQQLGSDLLRVERLIEEFERAPLPAEPLAPANAVRVSNAHLDRGERMKIRIEANWSSCGLRSGREVICDHLASDSLVKFLTRLFELKGVSVLERLSRFKVNRGMIVSRDPVNDYRNRRDPSGKPFQHKRIGNSEFFALTHSATKEKVECIKRICRFLGFPSTAVTVEEIAKNSDIPLLTE